MRECMFFNIPLHVNIPKAATIFTLCFGLFFLESCIHDDAYIKSLSNDINTQGFLSNNCYQCIITAQPDHGIEGLVANRESAHINLMQSLEKRCYDSLINTIEQLQGTVITNSLLRQCLLKQLKPYVDKKVIVVTYFNEDFSQTAVVRIYESELKQKLATLRCKQ